MMSTATSADAVVWRTPLQSLLETGSPVRSIFFFQAEDGIRCIGVTGVQTCALPIFLDGVLVGTLELVDDRLLERRVAELVVRQLEVVVPLADDVAASAVELLQHLPALDLGGAVQIGRASCRERVESGVVPGRQNGRA